MSSEPIFIRFENLSPPHRKFYEIEVELSLFYPKRLVRRWGRIGTRKPVSLRMILANPDEVTRRVALIARRRHGHGYIAVAEVHAPAIGTSAS